jgi:hypothetical protein
VLEDSEYKNVRIYKNKYDSQPIEVYGENAFSLYIQLHAELEIKCLVVCHIDHI